MGTNRLQTPMELYSGIDLKSKLCVQNEEF